MKKGYTLAETLVTLAIMGLIAGILYPVVKNSIPNRELVGFKKAYTTLDKVTNEMINDETLYHETEGFADLRTVGFNGENYGGVTKFCGIVAAMMGTTCVNNSFTTADGMLWTVQQNADFADNSSVTLVVDVDGPNKGENHIPYARSKKPDRFRITVSRTGATTVENNSIERIYIDTTRVNQSYKDLKPKN